MRYQNAGNIWVYVLNMCRLVEKLKGLKIEMPEDVLVHLMLISLTPPFSQFKMSYSCHKEKQSLNELISHFAEEEDQMKQRKVESANLASSSSLKKRKSLEWFREY